MSKRGLKTANLTASTCDRIDRIVKDGRYTACRGRDELVRYAVGLLLDCLDPPPGGSVTQRFMHEQQGKLPKEQPRRRQPG